MSRVFGVWHGGIGYGTGSFLDDMESWVSRRAARYALQSRYESNNWPCDDGAVSVQFDESGRAVLGDETGAIQYPVVDRESCYLDVYSARRIRDGVWEVSSEPCERWALGPRLGVQVESF